MLIRLFSPHDVAQLAAVFNASVMEGAQEYYSLTERLAWAQHQGEARSDAYWLTKLADTSTWVALEDDKLVSFISLRLCTGNEPDVLVGKVDSLVGKVDSLVDEVDSLVDEVDSLVGDVDCLFVHPEYSRAGVATLLYLALLEEAKRLNLKRLTVEASYQARPFFEKQGFSCIRRNELRRYLTAQDKQNDRAQVLVNFSLIMSLS